MPYTKVGPWVNGAPPALSAANLDIVETQYEEALMFVGARAAFPAAAAGNINELAFATNLNLLYYSDGAAWRPVPDHGVLTGTIFKVNVATGTMGNSHLMNDGSLVSGAVGADVIGEYAQILFPMPCHIRRFRYYGSLLQTGDGFWKIQYQDMDDSWVDWVVNIPTRGESWSAWDATGGAVIAKGVRWIATALDTQPAPDASLLYELEVK